MHVNAPLRRAARRGLPFRKASFATYPVVVEAQWALVNPHLKHSPHTIQDMHDFILLLNMYKHFKNHFSALWVFAMQVNGVQKF